MNFASELLVFAISLLIGLYVWLKHKQNYWASLKIPYIPATSIFGNFRDIILFRKNAAYVLMDLYNDKSTENEPAVGIYIFGTPALLVKDPELVKKVLVKDFNSFSDRYITLDPHKDVLGAYNMFVVKNPLWKAVRSNITPVFTSGKIKQMFPLIQSVGTELDDHLQLLTKSSNSICKEIKDLCALYTTDVIASVAFGIQANCIKNPNADFRKNGKEIFTFTWGRAIDFLVMFFLPKLTGILGSRVFTKNVTKFLKSAVNDAMADREKTGLKRNDLIDILLELKNTGKIDKATEMQINQDYLVAQAAIFFNAGFETSSATMSFGLYELSKQPNCQEKLRTEIKETLKENNGELTYDAINNMDYLNSVVLEVLRLYPPLPHLDRECTATKGCSVDELNDFVIPRGMPVLIPSYAIQRDPKYFSKPDEFNPERFSAGNKKLVNPYTFLPFGVGPHNCIGERLGLLQTKIGLINILKNHYVKVSSRTSKTMKLNPKALIIQSDDGIYLDIVSDPLLK